MWRADEILESIRAVLSARDAELREEQAVHGLDALSETQLQTLLATGLASARHGEPEWGVLREQPYPHEWRARRRAKAELATLSSDGDPHEPLPAPRDRLRCDVVLTPRPGQILGDPVLAEKTRRRVRSEGTGTLFESAAESDSAAAAVAIDRAPNPAAAPDSTHDRLPPEDAFWLEIKVVSQFTTSTGCPGPNHTYASELLRGVPADVAKLATDKRIARAAALLLLFTADQATANHDVVVMMHRCMDRGLPVTAPVAAWIPIPDRIGNGVLSAWLVEVRS